MMINISILLLLDNGKSRYAANAEMYISRSIPKGKH